MPEKRFEEVFRELSQDPLYRFWFLQTGFWLSLSLVSFFTLSVWYEQFGWTYIVHTLLQSFMGLCLSMPLYWVFTRMWDKPILMRGAVSIISVLLMSLVWTAARMITFIWISQEQGLWADFGGWYFGAIFIFLCWAGLFHGIVYYELLQSEHQTKLAAEATLRKEQLKSMKAQTVARDAKLEMLRYQLTPHFLCNTLNAISSLVQLNESQKAQRMIVQLSQFLRYSLDNNPDIKIALEYEVNALMLYLEIEKTRFGDRLQLDFQIDEEAKSAGVPSLLLQPLIENSMKYAISKNENGGTISLRATVNDNYLTLELSDTGSGTKLEKSKIGSSSGRGVGLRNTDERLEALFGNDYEFDLSTLPSGGFKTTIRLPYEQQFILNESGSQ